MANISNAKGIIKLEGDWREGEIALLTKYLEGFDREGGDYGIEFYEGFDPVKEILLANKEYSFYGSGRWSMAATIGSRFEDQKKSSAALVDAMRDKDLYLKFSYMDLETGVVFLVRCTDLITVGSEGLSLAQDCEDLPYTMRTLIDEDFWTEEDIVSNMESAFDGFVMQDGKDFGEFIGSITDVVYEKLLDTMEPYPYYETLADVPVELHDLVKEYCKVEEERYEVER